MFFLQERTNKQLKPNRRTRLPISDPSVPSAPLSRVLKAFPAFTHTDLDTGQVGGVYHTLMSLMDSIVSVMGSWNCRKREDCCPQCSCLVCRHPRILWCGRLRKESKKVQRESAAEVLGSVERVWFVSLPGVEQCCCLKGSSPSLAPLSLSLSERWPNGETAW